MTFTVYMEPTPKARARTFVDRQSGKVRSITPSKTTDAEMVIRAAWVDAGAAKFDAKVPLKMTVTAYRSRPKSLAKKVVCPITRPDVDNYAKLALDALNKFAFEDDSQVVELVAIKRFGDTPRVEIEIRETV